MATRITIGQQSGGPEDGGVMWAKIHLYKLLQVHCISDYCRAIDELSLVLRVSGSLDDFGPEAIERIRRRRPDRYITAYIVIPQSIWQEKTEIELKRYLASRVRTSLQLLAERLKKDKEPVALDLLLSETDNAITQFLSEPTPHKPWPADKPNKALADVFR
jgi:hypothetical protein